MVYDGLDETCLNELNRMERDVKKITNQNNTALSEKRISFF